MADLSEASDAQLVTAVGRYSEVALAEVYRRHGGAVFGLARRVLQNAAEAEDVVQEVFLRLWNEPDRFDAVRGSLRSYLLAQSHARAVDVVRSQNARRAREARDANRAARAGYDLENEAWDLSVAHQVARALASLPDEERRAIELAYFEGRTYVEVARLLDQPEGTVKSRIRNGMRRMRSTMINSGVRDLEGS
ncbi:MAG: sigma-70 family RNA polymerase sigma factor [Acidobacteriota bacterium]|nr:sigma-70 family RNA polymerase sigma factor [Acidobacteriota bacterium]